MAITQSASLMALGLHGDRGMTRHTSVPALGANVEFKFGRPKYMVRVSYLVNVNSSTQCCGAKLLSAMLDGVMGDLALALFGVFGDNDQNTRGRFPIL